jgi:hypothetical protein
LKPWAIFGPEANHPKLEEAKFHVKIKYEDEASVQTRRLKKYMSERKPF